MNMNRRDALKVGAVSVAAVAATTISGCAETGTAGAAAGGKMLGHHKVLIIGGGMGGLTVANNLKKIDKNFDVAIIEKNDTFMACPVSNTYLGKLEGMNLGTFVFDYAAPVEKYGYGMLKSEVIAIDRAAKVVTTAAGRVGYDILVLSPGIAYNYEGQFPTWSKAHAAEVKRACPPAMISGGEHVALERQLKNMDDGDVIIAAPFGKFRCPPAPYERAAMIAEFMRKEDIQGKVYVLVPGAKFAKMAAFKESAKDIYGDKIVYVHHAKVDDVDVKGKTVHFTQMVPSGKKDEDGDMIMKAVKKSHKYQVCNLIVNHKSSPVVQMATLQTTADAFKKVKMAGCTFQTATDKDVYAVGDIVGHAIPPSGQTAVWAGKQCALEIAHRLHGKSYTLGVKTTPVKAANVCFSMVGGAPEEGIMVTHDFSWTGAVIKGKGHVPKAPSGKFRSKNTAKALRDWYRGITSDLFA
ncbi:MAG: FAD-dependent oxidoreductase [Sulfurimonas sp.]|nr:FAD-dependent oxidoreductase [Sulfurimonas sp.]MDQ7060143.1 FAD-dependent oxidoreductase [Sulfurimonas sp.]